jgi:hypothetical protein
LAAAAFFLGLAVFFAVVLALGFAFALLLDFAFVAVLGLGFDLVRPAVLDVLTLAAAAGAKQDGVRENARYGVSALTSGGCRIIRRGAVLIAVTETRDAKERVRDSMLKVNIINFGQYYLANVYKRPHAVMVEIDKIYLPK